VDRIRSQLDRKKSKKGKKKHRKHRRSPSPPAASALASSSSSSSSSSNSDSESDSASSDSGFDTQHIGASIYKSMLSSGSARLFIADQEFTSERNRKEARVLADALDAFPASLVTQIHLAVHAPDQGLGTSLLIDSHDQPVAEPVWALF
jgi:hypothetical protein